MQPASPCPGPVEWFENPHHDVLLYCVWCGEIGSEGNILDDHEGCLVTYMER